MANLPCSQYLHTLAPNNPTSNQILLTIPILIFSGIKINSPPDTVWEKEA